MKNITVMVTGVGGGGNGEQLLKCLKLSNNNYTIIGGDMSSVSKGLLEVDIPYILPPANDKTYIETVMHLCDKHDVKALFTGSEPELKVISKNRKKFEEKGIFIPMNPEQVINICMDKNKTMEWLKRNGFNCPESFSIKTERDISKIRNFPVVLKPSIGSGGSTNVFIVQNKEELEMFGKYLLKIYEEFIAQRYVGDVHSEFTVGVLLDMNGNFINSIAVKKNILSGLSNRIKVKNKTGIKNLGEILAISSGISQGDIGKYPEVTKECEKVAVKLGCTGAVNIQCRYYENKVYIFEINPRFSGTSSLRALVGYNEPDVLIRKHLLGEEIQTGFPYSEGCIMRGLEEKLIENYNIKSLNGPK